MCVSPVCVAVCVCVGGRGGGACSHTLADWLRPHLAVESTGARSHVDSQKETQSRRILVSVTGGKVHRRWFDGSTGILFSQRRILDKEKSDKDSKVFRFF